MIVGFPGESDDEWRQTEAFVAEMAFGHVHIFAYSPRNGTKAAGMPGQIDHAVKRARSAALHRIADTGRRSALAAAVGRTHAVLIEGRDDSGAWTGYTPNYLRVALDPMPGLADNSIVAVDVQRLDAAGSRLEGRISAAQPDI